MYFIYIVKCRDGTLYTGYTRDVTRRVLEHNNSNIGAKYTKARRPVTLVYHQEFESETLAKKAEYAIKRLTRLQKLNLVNSQNQDITV